MKLSDAVGFTLDEARIAYSSTILEDGEGPRWRFGYDGNRVHDPNPDILLLGSWKHPNTKNNLVGGINLHYLDEKQKDKLARVLPQIMQAGNLKQRYWTGRELLPDVFKNNYRTYNANFIRGVRKEVMFPKYGFVKTAQNWLKNKVGGLFKSKAQRQQDSEPEYPDDLGQMQDRLDQVVSQLQHEPPIEEPEDSPEMRTARKAFQDLQRNQTLAGIKDLEDRPLRHAQHDHKQETGELPPAEEPDMMDQLQVKQDFEEEQLENRAELENPNNEIELGDGEVDLEESISYYSPRLKRYVFEHNTITEDANDELEDNDITRVFPEDEYDGLEDNDEFEEAGAIGPCYVCDNTVNMYGIEYFECNQASSRVAQGMDRCNSLGHFSCVIQSEQDLASYNFRRNGLLSSGWYLIGDTEFGVVNKAICPTCVEINNGT